LPDGTVLEGTPAEIAAWRGQPRGDTFNSFGERDNRRGDEPDEDGPIVPPDEPLVLND
jgi:hypothetical protein